MNRMVRVCACCNNTVFVGDSQTVQAENKYTKGEKKAIRRQCDAMEGAWPEGKTIPFRWVRENPQGSSNPFSYLTDQWKTAGDATESAMVRWVQDKPLFCDASYTAAGASKMTPQQAKELRRAAARTSSIRKRVRRLEPTGRHIPCQVTENKTKDNPKEPPASWAIPFNSKNKFQVSVHVQNGKKDESASSHEG